jgi:methanogenic corrinoid protein MtbC1
MTTLTNLDLSSKMQARKQFLTDKITQMHFEQNPSIRMKYSQSDLLNYQNDCYYHMDFLSQSIAHNSPAIYRDYVVWVQQLFKNLNIPDEHVLSFFKCFNEVLFTELDKDGAMGLKSYLDISLEVLNNNLIDSVSYIEASNPLNHHANVVLQKLLDGKKAEAATYVVKLVQDGLSLKDCYLKLFQPIQYEVGRLWHTHQISVAQEHYVTSAAQLIMSQFYSQIFNHEKTGNTLVAACISEEQHEIGLRMVTDLLEMDGWDTYFLGANTPLNTIPDTIIEKKAKVIAISITLSSHLYYMDILLNLVKQKVPYVKVLVGGYPFNIDKDLWQKVGADGYALDAESALQVANKLIS